MGLVVPWTADDAPRHTKRARSEKLRELWARVANAELEETGDDAHAVRMANAAVKRAVEHDEVDRADKRR